MMVNSLLCMSAESFLLALWMVIGSVFNTHDVAEEGGWHHRWTVPCRSVAAACLLVNKEVSLH